MQLLARPGVHVRRAAVGVVTKTDLAPDEASKARARELLELAGVQKVFLVSSVTGEGIAEFAEFLQTGTSFCGTERVKARTGIAGRSMKGEEVYEKSLKKAVGISLCAAIALQLAACGGSKKAEAVDLNAASLDKIIEEAKKEGKLESVGMPGSWGQLGRGPGTASRLSTASSTTTRI